MRAACSPLKHRGGGPKASRTGTAPAQLFENGVTVQLRRQWPARIASLGRAWRRRDEGAWCTCIPRMRRMHSSHRVVCSACGHAVSS